MSSLVVMAKKKSAKPSESESQREAIIALRCTADYKAWVEAFAESERTIPTLLLDRALFDMAKAKGFRTPPKR